MESNGRLAVAMVEPIGGHSGNDFYDFGLCNALAAEGVRVVFYTCDETDLDRRFAFPFATEKPFKRIYGADPKLLRGFRYALGAWRAVQHARQQRLSLVHLHIYHFAAREYLNLMLFSSSRFRVVATIHDVENFETFGQTTNPKVYRKFMNRIHRIIVHSDYAKASVEKYFQGFPSDHIHVVPHGDSDFLYQRPASRSEARQRLGIPEHQPLVLFFGQIKKVKGLDVLLKAWAMVLQQMPQAHLLVVGRPWKVEQHIFDQIIAERQLASSCTMHYRYVPNEIVPTYFAAADLVVLPYREIYSSGVMVRALDYGAAIVASDLQAFRNIIRHGHNGFLFRSEDENDLAEKIMMALSDEGRLARLRQEAKKTADEQFSWQVIGRQVAHIYQMTMRHD